MRDCDLVAIAVGCQHQVEVRPSHNRRRGTPLMHRRVRSLLAVCVVLASAAGLAACAADETSSADAGKLQVGTTVAPITSIVANIGGDRVKITGIVPEGTNSHTFEPKPSDAELLSRVDVMFINGLKLEDP